VPRSHEASWTIQFHRNPTPPEAARTNVSSEAVTGNARARHTRPNENQSRSFDSMFAAVINISFSFIIVVPLLSSSQSDWTIRMGLESN
jgi:hypothetical protein